MGMDPQLLLRYAQDTTEAGRYKLASAVSGFFDEKVLTENERNLATGIVMDLIRQAALDLREALAERLSLHDNIPVEVIEYLANDVISVARPVLMHSPVLTDAILMQIVESKGADYWRSIAGRSRLGVPVADRLVDTGDSATVMNLVGNKDIVLTGPSLKKIVKFSLTSEELHVPLLQRPEMNGDIAAGLYMCVSHALQKEIAGKFPGVSAAVNDSLETLLEELCLGAGGCCEVTPEMMTLARRFRERDEISPGFMIRLLRRGQKAFFLAVFSEKTGLDPETVVSLIQKDGGKPFALACRFIGMMKSEFASIFLLSRSIRTDDKIVDQRELSMALKYYDALKEFDIQQSMRMWMKIPQKD